MAASSTTTRKPSSKGRVKKAVRKTRAQDRPVVIEYDDKARQDYLTGFHKRKLEKKRAGAARRAALEREELREARRERARPPLASVQEELDRIEALNEEVRNRQQGHSTTGNSLEGQEEGPLLLVKSRLSGTTTTTRTVTSEPCSSEGATTITSVTITPLEL